MNAEANRSAGRRAPLIAADAVGNFAVAWQEYDRNTGASAIVLRRFDAAGKAQAPEQALETSHRDYLALERLEADAAGNFAVVYQRVQGGASAGHFRRNFDGNARTLGQLTRVADE